MGKGELCVGKGGLRVRSAGVLRVDKDRFHGWVKDGMGHEMC